MKRVLFLLVFIPVFSFSQYTTIPGENFEQALIDLGYDDVIDGKVLTENISSIDSLGVSRKKISDLSGIEAFTSLKRLDCRRNKLTSLDVSNNTALAELHCRDNQLISLDVSNNTALIYFYCSGNKFDCEALRAKYNFR